MPNRISRFFQRVRVLFQPRTSARSILLPKTYPQRYQALLALSLDEMSQQNEMIQALYEATFTATSELIDAIKGQRLSSSRAREALLTLLLQCLPASPEPKEQELRVKCEILLQAYHSSPDIAVEACRERLFALQKKLSQARSYCAEPGARYNPPFDPRGSDIEQKIERFEAQEQLALLPLFRAELEANEIFFSEETFVSVKILLTRRASL